MNSKILDVGCGQYCLDGAIGMDMESYPGVQVVHDMNQAPWPLPDNHFERIRCQHVIEHIQNLKGFAKELLRISKNQCVIDFITPHYSSCASWGDPTHVHHFALESIPMLFRQNIGADQFQVKKNEIKFTGSVSELFGWLIYKSSKRTYEKHFAWVFPANEIHTDIEIQK
jgi:ubiquinone/menaquinone biosynthesis C-methylase UbiE